MPETHTHTTHMGGYHGRFGDKGGGGGEISCVVHHANLLNLVILAVVGLTYFWTFDHWKEDAVMELNKKIFTVKNLLIWCSTDWCIIYM